MNKSSRRYSTNTVWNTTRNWYLADVGVAPLALEDPNPRPPTANAGGLGCYALRAGFGISKKRRLPLLFFWHDEWLGFDAVDPRHGDGVERARGFIFMLEESIDFFLNGLVS